ncbi:uncharacterized protein [Watersipora subatra]|uniref:uncharacterized protein n=1 Tax=Watersipora subatra TaxID=2589382 RepID=UPI00355BA202
MTSDVDETKTQDSLEETKEKGRKKRSMSLYMTSEHTESYYRHRSNSWPPRHSDHACNKSDDYQYWKATISEKHILAVMTNISHIVLGFAITQLGIVGTWYQHYMNFAKDQLQHIVYICVLFIILGVYGMCIVVKRLAITKAHRVAYIVLSTFGIMASCFIMANSFRILVSDRYQSEQTVVVLFDGLMLTLSGFEIPVTLVALYVTTPNPHHPPTPLEKAMSPNNEKALKPHHHICSIFTIILNVAHIVLGLCITELGMVGMMYRNVMNIDNTGLFAVVLISLSFISVGILGIYNQLTGKAFSSCNRSIYTIASLLAAGSAAFIVSVTSLTMSSSHYYTGIEAIVAFDAMILSMSSIELLVTVVAIALCLLPICLAKLGQIR